MASDEQVTALMLWIASILYWRIGNGRKQTECCRDLFKLR
jgi:hypothetical protein